MPFQNYVPKEMPAAYPGGEPSINPQYSVAGVAGADLIPGTFGALAESATNPTDAYADPALVMPGGTGAVGIILRARPGAHTGQDGNSTPYIRKGYPAEIRLRGDAVVQVDIEAGTVAVGAPMSYREADDTSYTPPAETIGSIPRVFSNPSKGKAGEVSFATTPPAGFIPTEWSVTKILDPAAGIVAVSTVRRYAE